MTAKTKQEKAKKTPRRVTDQDRQERVNEVGAACEAISKAIQHLKKAQEYTRWGRGEEEEYYASQLRELLSSDGGEAGLLALLTILQGSADWNREAK